jgi:carboxypeptidase Taq
MASTAYETCKQEFGRIGALGEAAGILHWDASAMMPPGGGNARGEQLAALAGVQHELMTSAKLGAALATASAEGEWDAANLALMRRAQARATAVPTALVEAAAKASAACEMVWRQAKAQNDFGQVEKLLTEVVALQRETAQALGAALGMDPYDALMDGYQPGVTAAEVEPVFAAYEAFLADALPRAEALQARRPAPLPLPGPFPVDAQRRLCRNLAERVGLEFKHARLDESLHPFCGGNPADIRITTFYDEANVAKALLGVLHETGHAMYERHLPAGWARQPVGEAAGMAAHESQSLIVEMQACRSDAFLSFLGRELHATFGGDAAPYAPANLAALWRRVGRGFIRVDADELTYPAHVIFRFRIERALIGGAIEVRDLPAAWNEGIRCALGITPPDDARGVLQDIHWYDGAFGYFPSYTLGAMAASQLMAAARRALPDMDSHLAAGDLAPLMRWLNGQVHGQGARLGFQDLLRHATGRPLDPADFTAHLTARYLTEAR